MKLHLGACQFLLEGWQNHDIDVDLRKPLPFPDGSATHIFLEHTFEHLTPAEGWRFLIEAHRVLSEKGKIRIAVPDIVQVWFGHRQDYLEFLKEKGWGDGSARSSIEHLIVNHGHQSLWTDDLLQVVLLATGYSPVRYRVGESDDPSLKGVEQHGRAIGDANNRLETIVYEGWKWDPPGGA